eukprot:m.4861 g.4861  ORF g.4861 m.4861 type:complete len:119 (-) comp3788_c0_seq1:218-574(-)
MVDAFHIRHVPTIPRRLDNQLSTLENLLSTYPSNLPGASTFNGTSCGRGIVEDQCAQACDAASAPECDSFTFTDTGGLCFLYNGGSCDTYATPGKTSYWTSSQCPMQQDRVLKMAHLQ